MKKLPTCYHKNGYEFDLIERGGNIAIYRLSLDGEGKAYEVFEVQQYAERIVKGTVIPSKEATPSNEQWGSKGFTYWSLEDAQKRAERMRKVRNKGNLEERMTRNCIEAGLANQKTMMPTEGQNSIMPVNKAKYKQLDLFDVL